MKYIVYERREFSWAVDADSPEQAAAIARDMGDHTANVGYAWDGRYKVLRDGASRGPLVDPDDYQP